MAKSAGNALLSVYDKAGIEKFAKNLVALGWNVYASGGTAKAIEKSGTKVSDISELVGGGAILGHRVVSLSREIYAGILSDSSAEHKKELKKLGLPRIDLICVDMYPLVDEINKPDSTEKSVTEQTDVGGPTLLHAGVKGRRIVLSRSSQREMVIDWLRAGKPREQDFIGELISVAEYEVADYMIQSANYLGGGHVTGLIGERIAAPTYGENPWQKGAGLYVSKHDNDELGIKKFKLLQGIPLSYNNYTDIDRLLQTITHIAAGFEKNYKDVPLIALGAKHGNVCGAGHGDNKQEVLQKMLDGDKRAIFGGTIMTNFEIDKAEAETILHYESATMKRILDIVVAPRITEGGKALLKRKTGKLRLFVNPALENIGVKSIDSTQRVRHVRGGRLKQDNYDYIVDCSSPEIQRHGVRPDEARTKDMLMAWAVGSTSNSNTISIVKEGRLLANGVGQQDRVTSAELALMRAKNAGHQTKGAVAYSDSFFPFEDGLQMLIDAGIKAVFTTRGSVRDGDIVELAKKSGISFCTLPDKQARGFFGH